MSDRRGQNKYYSFKKKGVVPVSGFLGVIYKNIVYTNKKPDASAPGLKLFQKSMFLFHLRNQPFERLRIVHGNIGQHLTVNFNAFLAKQVDELRVRQSFFANSSIDAGNPQAAVFALFQ